MTLLASLRGAPLDLRLPLAGGARVRIVERPGAWMDDAGQRALLDDLRTVVRAGVPAGSLEYGVFADPARLARAVVTIVYDGATQRPVAFNVLHLLACDVHGRHEDVLHLGLVLIDPAVRQQGLMGALYGLTCFLRCARQQFRPLWVTNVTQVPVVFGIVSDFIADVFPAPSPLARRSFTHVAIAREVMAHHRAAFGVGADATFDERRFVIENAYTGGSDHLRKSFDDAPKARDEAVNAYCRAQLDYARGDDFLQVGRFTAAVARRYLTRSAPVLAPTALLTRAALLAAESVLAPVLQWFSPDRAMGPLRPAHEPGVTP
ncbi:MAG: hypothetical protein HY275_12170 [Gemmatimonadetes bacterium]|nr:hypothetical protein [Gemmatimonadota bacterium]